MSIVKYQLTLMRGPSGCGKSTKAREILADWYMYEKDVNLQGHIFSTDDYWYRLDPTVYNFQVEHLGAAHKWNQNRVKEEMTNGNPLVIVDNTNIQYWEMKPYVELTNEYGYRVSFEEPTTEWAFNPEVLANKTQHNVPIATLRRMVNNYSWDATIEKVMESTPPTYK